MIINDKIDNDWAYVILAKQSNDEYRAIDVGVSFESIEVAERNTIKKINELTKSGEFKEELYTESGLIKIPQQNIIITNIDDEVKKYLKKHPEKLHELSPRKFEELVASILEDMGLDVQLTQATRDGGSDIIASVKNTLTSLLILVECKKYSPENKVDVSVIRQVAGVHLLKNPAKSIIVTTSTFTRDAIKETKLLNERVELKDYDNLKEWLSKY